MRDWITRWIAFSVMPGLISFCASDQISSFSAAAAATRVISSTLFTARLERRSSLTSTRAAFGKRFFRSR